MSNKVVEILKQSYVTRPIGFLDSKAKTELFKEISVTAGGVFSTSHTPGNVLSTLRIAIPYKKWEIVLTESDTRPLRFQVGFVSLLDYELLIGAEDVFDKILKKLGKPEIEVGDRVFDSHYLIHSNDPVITGKLLNETARSKILKHSLYTISYLTDAKRKKSELTSVVSRILEDKDAYLDLISLHQMLIDSLSELVIVS